MRRPVRIAIVNDYDVVVQGLARMFEPFKDRIEVVEVSTNKPGVERVDIALIDSFAQTRHVNEVLAEANAERYVFYSWSLEPELIETWARFGVVGFLDKRLTAEELADALERIQRARAGSPAPTIRPRSTSTWATGRAETRAQRPRGGGHRADHPRACRNEQIAAGTFMSINTVKTYIRSAYRKMGVDSRTRAVLWGVDHGFRPDNIAAKAPDRVQSRQ